MQRVDKATAQKNTETLRRLVKSETNKWCADCKDKDARWASWNIGIFICIRCSGFHRSMGTHISKVKSVDLDSWTNEQVESMIRWGNHRANLYWEAHLRPGHRPPEHKMESFIRSKYEMRRWAREGPPPSDPTTLEQEGSAVNNSQESSAAAQALVSTPPLVSPSSQTLVSPQSMSDVVTSQPVVTSRQPQPHRLLSAAMTGRASVDRTQQVAAAAPVTTNKDQQAVQSQAQPQNDLFSLDFHAPSPSAQQHQRVEAPKKDVKQDILSLFSAPANSAPSQPGAFGGQHSSGLDTFGQWGQSQVQAQQNAQLPVMNNASSEGLWGGQPNWGASAPSSQSSSWVGQQATATTVRTNNAPGIFETQSIWGSTTQTAQNGATGDLFGALSGTTNAVSTSTQKKDDVFGDIWGDFK